MQEDKYSNCIKGSPVNLFCQELFHKKLEQFQEQEAFKKIATQGGYYSENDMKKRVSEGGLGFSQSLCCKVVLMACKV